MLTPISNTLGEGGVMIEKGLLIKTLHSGVYIKLMYTLECTAVSPQKSIIGTGRFWNKKISQFPHCRSS